MSEKADIRELAVAVWRLEKWLDKANVDRKLAARSALKAIRNYLDGSGVEVKDPTGARFDPGLAVEVVNHEAEDAPEESLRIVETLTPYIYQHGELIQPARVIIGTADGEAGNGGTEKREESAAIKQTDIEEMMAYAKVF